ncbi:MAG TPA: lipid-A-disaccharide synthase N-terminal domain-containing protein [Pontiellaceae bacterium]|nr:lipid-A-disaccharide synthase N-terminal domain-containing protein [Pontiellaceae bacterium]
MNGWLILGFFAQALFASRFIIQWIASERAGESVMPEAFWMISLAGSTLLLVYAIYKQDPVFILGQASGLLVYFRNIHLIERKKKCGKK